MLTSILQDPWPLLASLFPWGNHYLIPQNNLPKAQLLAWDPSPFCQFPEPQKTSEREKRWSYATLQNHDKWLAKQQITWPVDRFIKETGYVPEDQLIAQEYPRRWGILAPRYKSASSGWWRVRFNHAAHTESIMVCDRDDARVMGCAYQVSPRTVELMSDTELASLARKQRDWFYANIATQEKTANDLQAALQAAVSKAVIAA